MDGASPVVKGGETKNDMLVVLNNATRLQKVMSKVFKIDSKGGGDANDGKIDATKIKFLFCRDWECDSDDASQSEEAKKEKKLFRTTWASGWWDSYVREQVER